ncbi:hypothetical protein ACFL2B_02790 [Patescibacteria group bacterium]
MKDYNVILQKVREIRDRISLLKSEEKKEVEAFEKAYSPGHPDQYESYEEYNEICMDFDSDVAQIQTGYIYDILDLEVFLRNISLSLRGLPLEMDSTADDDYDDFSEELVRIRVHCLRLRRQLRKAKLLDLMRKIK